MFNEEKKWYAVDVMLTNRCSMRCEYCIENEYDNYHINTENDNKEYKIEDVLKFLDNLLEYCLKTNEYYGIEIHLWGGEPTLKLDKIRIIVEHFMNSDNVRFMISSNGYHIDKFLNYINKPSIKFKKVVDGSYFFFTQISYDGAAIQEKKRLDKNNKNTVKVVNESIKFLKDNALPHALKSTITLDCFENLYDAYCDIVQHLEFCDYFPTIDYRSYIINQYSEEQFQYYLNVLKQQLFKIIKDYEAKQILQYGFSKFLWLNYDRRICAVGWSMCAIDTDGSIYPCHGALTMPSKKDHYIGNIVDKDIINTLFIKSEKQLNKRKEIPDNCSKCDAIYCLRCDISKYEVSDKKEYYERLFDYTSQGRLCQIYKLISNISIALHRRLNVPVSG